MNLPILEVKNIGKAYRNYSSELWRILSWFGIKHKAAHETWTLQHINFSIAPGEAVGIIGQNGAGKSTLLKIITGTLKPTTGSVHVNGKIAAILELGMGFHPDLTGRQNAYHAAGLMGYTQQQIDSVIDEIESFADIGDYFEQPVRTYSSGMQARVAFAVATTFRPDILIVDEALSVGDMYFQQKSINKIKQMLNDGSTLIFVSHSLGQVKSICKKALYLEHGNQVAFGESEAICTLYQNTTTNTNKEVFENAMSKIKEVLSNKETKLLKLNKNSDGFFRIDPNFDKRVINRSGSGEIKIVSVDILDQHGNNLENVEALSEISVVFSMVSFADIPAGSSFGFLIRDDMGNDFFACNTNYYNYFLEEIPVDSKISILIKLDFPLMAGRYSIQCGIKPHFSSSYFYDRPFNVKVFDVYNPKFLEDKFFGGRLYVKPKEIKLFTQKKVENTTPFDFININHFKSDLSYSEQKEIFKNSIIMVEIENFSYCNRKCWFCPNSFIDRKSDNIFLNENLYVKVLKELQEIEYSNLISFSRYNEPLADKRILERIHMAKEYLPFAILHTNTNGDYLTEKYLEELYDAGLRSLDIQCYQNSKEFDYNLAKNNVFQKTISLKLTENLTIDKSDWIEIATTYKEMKVRVYARNFLVNGVNRGGSIDIIESLGIRTSPCLSPFYHIYIDYNGNCMPCCNLRSDFMQHEKYIIGNIVDHSIFEIYNKSVNWRKTLINYKSKQVPCDTCSFVTFENNNKNISKTLYLNKIIDEVTKG